MSAAPAHDRIRWGVLLPSFDPLLTGRTPVVEAARRAEALGFDGVWAGDHLIGHVPLLDAVVSLAAAAAVTDHVDIGLGVLQLALRHPAWAAKQLVTLDAIAPGRVRIGVGAGGEYDFEFEAAGVDHATRGRRLDEILGILPALLRGDAVDHAGPLAPVRLPGLLPAVSGVPPISVGGRSDAALRRAARFGQQWLGMWHDPETVGAAAIKLAKLAADAGRPTPTLGMLVLVHVDDDIEIARRGAEELIAAQYHVPFRVVDRWTGYGPVERVADLLGRYRDVGVSEFVLMPATADSIAQYERLVAVRRLVDSGRL